METWKSIPGYGNYEVSSEGRIRNSFRDRLMKAYVGKNGYVRIQLGRKVKTELVHRLVLLTFVGSDESRPWVNHKNGIRHDNRLENLEWSTPSENMIHKFQVLNAKHPMTHLTINDVRTIRLKIQSGEKRSILAETYKISVSAIHAIASRQNWKNLL